MKNCQRVIVFGSKRIPYISVPLRSIEIEPYEIYSWGSPFRRFKAAATLFKVCKKFPDAPVIVDTPHWMGLAVLIITTLINRDYFLLLRGDVFKEFKSAFAIWMNKKILKNAKGIIFVSRYLKDKILHEIPTLDKFTVVPCPYLLKPVESNVSKEHKNILTVTGFYFYDKVKPLLMIIDVVDEFLDRFQDLTWDICGGGPYLKEAMKKANSMKNSKRIKLHGHCNNVAFLYDNAFLFLYFTGLDTFPLVITEAYLHGLPVVANKAVSMTEVIEDDKDGFLVDMNLHDWKDKLLDRLTFLFENPHAAFQMGLKGKEKVVNKYNPERIGTLLREFLR